MPLRPKMTPRDFGGIFLRGKWIILLTAASFLLAAGVYCAVTPTEYRSSISILIIPQSVPREYVRSTVSFRAEQQLATIRQQVLSRTALTKVMDETGIFQEERGKMGSEAVLSMVRKRIDIDVVRNHGGNEVFSISFQYEEPRLAMRVVDRLAYVFIEENLKTREKQAVGTSEFLDSQLEEAKARLERMEQRVRNYKMRFMGELPQQMDANLRILTGLQDRLRANEISLRAAEERQILLDAQAEALWSSPPAAPASSTEETAAASGPQAALESRLARKARLLAELETRYTDNVPEVASVKAEVADLRKSLAEPKRPASPAVHAVPASRADGESITGTPGQLRQMASRQRAGVAEIASLQRDRGEILKAIAGIEGKVGKSPIREQEMTAMVRDYENQKKSYDDLLSKKLEADVSQNLEKRQKGIQFQILDPANLPDAPFHPNRRKVMGGALLVSLALGFGIVLLREAMDQRLRDVGDFRHLYKVRVLGSIPELGDRRARRVETLRQAAARWGALAAALSPRGWRRG